MTLDGTIQSMAATLAEEHNRAKDQAIRRLMQRNLGPLCPTAAEDVVTVLSARGSEPRIVIPPDPAPPFAALFRDDQEIDREPLPAPRINYGSLNVPAWGCSIPFDRRTI